MRINIQALTWLAAFAIPLSAAQGATLVWSASIDNGFSTAEGSNLAAGNLVRVGTFNLTPAEISANALNINFLNANFVEFASGSIGDGFAGAPEHFQLTDDADTSALGINIAGAQAYIWVFASSDNSSTAASLNTALQHGIFAFDKGLNATPADAALAANWAIPSNDSFDVPIIDITHLTNEAGTALVPGAMVLAGTFSAGTSDTSGAPNFALQVVPEPASAGLAIVGGMALLLRRRRRA